MGSVVTLSPRARRPLTGWRLTGNIGRRRAGQLPATRLKDGRAVQLSRTQMRDGVPRAVADLEAEACDVSCCGDTITRGGRMRQGLAHRTRPRHSAPRRRAHAAAAGRGHRAARLANRFRRAASGDRSPARWSSRRPALARKRQRRSPAAVVRPSGSEASCDGIGSTDATAPRSGRSACS
jgi:hypothetical protein